MFRMTDDATRDLLKETRERERLVAVDAIGGVKNMPGAGSPMHLRFLAVVEARVQTALLAELVQWTRRRP